jgi:hypothetical protein
MVLDKFRAINPDFAVVERLAELATAYPFEAVHCLGIIFGKTGTDGPYTVGVTNRKSSFARPSRVITGAGKRRSES